MIWSKIFQPRQISLKLLIRDSSNSYPRFYDLMLAGESQSTHYGHQQQIMKGGVRGRGVSDYEITTGT